MSPILARPKSANHGIRKAGSQEGEPEIKIQ
jgi:hypothetical protein